MTDPEVNVLNDLIEVCGDGEKGFSIAAADVTEAKLRTLLKRRAARCADSAEELKQLVKARDGIPTAGGSLGGALHRGWAGIRAEVTGNPDFAILQECERGEDSARQSYEKAMTEDLSQEVLLVLRRQYQGVLQHQNEVQKLRDEIKDEALD